MRILCIIDNLGSMFFDCMTQVLQGAAELQSTAAFTICPTRVQWMPSAALICR
jgi:hypothetical protein